MLLQINKKAITIAILAIFAVSMISVIFLYLDNQNIHSPKIESITVAIPPLEQNALLYIAANQGFFVNNGLNVTIKNYDFGLASINALLNGEASIAESAEFPFVNAICNNNSISVITVNDEFENDLPKGVQSKMFTLMFTTKSKGQGFGLPVVKRMTESLGGTVAFESEEGKGTTFFVRLPQKNDFSVHSL